MKSNVTDLPSDVEIMRRLLPEILDSIRGRLNFLKQLDAPMQPQEDVSLDDFLSVSLDEAERTLLMKLGFVEFAVRFKSSNGGMRVHHNSHMSRELAVFQVTATDSETKAMRSRFRVVVLCHHNVQRITRWQSATPQLIVDLINVIVEVYRRFVLESSTLDTAIAGVVIYGNSISIKYNITTEVPNEKDQFPFPENA